MASLVDLCNYKIALVAVAEGTRSKNRKFWETQISKHGGAFFCNKSPEALKSKWCKILKQVQILLEQ